MSAPATAKLVGRWRIVEVDIWDKDFLDLVETAHLTFKGAADGEIAFGALKAFLDIEYSRSSVGFTCEGFDEMDEVRGGGSAELLSDGSIEIEFAYHNRRRSRPQSQTRYFFNSLLGRVDEFAAAELFGIPQLNRA